MAVRVGAGVGVGEAGKRRGKDGERGRQRRRGVEERVAEREDRVLGRGRAEEEAGERPRREAARPGLHRRRDGVAGLRQGRRERGQVRERHGGTRGRRRRGEGAAAGDPPARAARPEHGAACSGAGRDASEEWRGEHEVGFYWAYLPGLGPKENWALPRLKPAMTYMRPGGSSFL